jgi:hypothetical protein
MYARAIVRRHTGMVCAWSVCKQYGLMAAYIEFRSRQVLVGRQCKARRKPQAGWLGYNSLVLSIWWLLDS